MGKRDYRQGSRLHYYLLILLIIIALATFHSTLEFEFTGYDEHSQVVENPYIRSLSSDNLYLMFSNFLTRSYYPIRLLSCAFDYQLWGLDPMGYHLTNVILHILNILLLYVTLLRLIKLTSITGAKLLGLKLFGSKKAIFSQIIDIKIPR